MVPGLAKLNGCPDQDKDDIADKDDACPEVPGLARFQGCPDSDSDGDGIQDAMDKCPNMKGLDMFKGCPDTDNDGVDDANDKCPGTEAGIKVDALGCSADADRDGIIDSDDKCPDTPKGIKVDMKGCPADTDGDGVIDTNDKCPTTKGEGSTNGCPVIKEDVKKRLNFAARGIQFESGKATLKTTSNSMLDEVVSILKEYTDYNLIISGHTDNVGGDDMNMILSQERVDAVKAYLLSKGVTPTRLTATGFGETKPISTNDTEVGRSQNRRVELELVIR
jgi:outer membrane protein OmpA-like peptidoglycan-associated protein